MLNEALRLIRAYHNLSQTQLCADLGVSNSYLSEIESGKKTPTLEFLNKFSERFGIPLSSLIFFSENIDSNDVTEKLRVSVAKKVISILKWVGDKNIKN